MLSDINDTCRRIARKLDIDMEMLPNMSVNRASMDTSSIYSPRAEVG